MDVAGMYGLWALFLIVLAIVWILLPFAIFGTKPKLDEIAKQLREANAQLLELKVLLAAPKVVAQREESATNSSEGYEPKAGS